jgi:hypothetical protein
MEQNYHTYLLAKEHQNHKPKSKKTGEIKANVD